jgi:gliding motility-associated-like protein
MDKNGNLLQNGNNLNGNESSTQGALILPHPSLDNHYLLFTTPFFNTTGSGLYYNVINMALNNGLGGVVAGQKNILLYANVSEGLTYTYNNDSTGYWLLTHERLSNTFLSFEINKTGIGVNLKKSNIGRVWGSNSDFASYIKLSPNGKKVSVSNIVTNANWPNISGPVEVYNFDNCTGRISDIIIIKNLPWCYGNAFSSNSNILYISSFLFPSRVFQVNLSAGSEIDINASLQTIYTVPLAPPIPNRTYYLGGLQLHEDGKIYLVETSQKFLHCINNPNEIGNNCNFVAEQIKLVGGSFGVYNLPQLVPVKLKEPKIILDSVIISINDTCIENIEKAVLLGINNPTAINWKLINLNNSAITLLKDSLSFNLSNLNLGEYILEVMVTKNCKNYFASKRFRIFDCQCSGKIEISDTCVQEEIKLNILTNDGYTSIDWLITDISGTILYNQKSNDAVFKVDTALAIYVRAIVNFNCKIDTLNAVYNLATCPKNITLNIPNVFTPNGDLVNDYFETTISNFKQLKQLNGIIYNRWGQQIYEFSVPNGQWWDGNYQGNQCQEGVYFYILNVETKNGKTQNFHGTVTLIR